MATLVFFHAHPDDEAIGTGGTMARMVDEGHRVVLVTATDGALGEVPDGLLEPGETLAQRRARELDAACEVLGVSRHEMLGFRDSGMAGEASNLDPSSFCQIDVDVAAAPLVAILEQEKADVIVYYDENGTYGHPDHIQVHNVGTRAAERAGVARRYMATVNRDYVRSLADAAEEAGASVGPPRDMIKNLGVPGDRITTKVDVSAYVQRKRDAMRAHVSQISDSSFFLAMDDATFAATWGQEWYIHVGARPAEPYEATLLPD
jgi:LmbE family N-acetylglucosaminyl deacetylase